jgi:hypothetical protein
LAGDPVTVILAAALPVVLVIDRAFRIEVDESFVTVFAMSMIEVVFFGLLWSNNAARIYSREVVPGNKIAAGTKWCR